MNANPYESPGTVNDARAPLPAWVWITDHTLIDDDATYVVFAIVPRPDKSTFLCGPDVCKGWQFKQRLKGCYAGMPMPEWTGLPAVIQTTKSKSDTAST